MTNTRRLSLAYLALTAGVAVLFALNLFWGSVSLTPGAVAAALLGRGEDALAVGIVLQLRLPRAVMVVLLGAALVALGGWALVLAACAVFVRYYHAAKNQFGGTTGDLAGWFLQKCEIWMLAALAACQWLGVL